MESYRVNVHAIMDLPPSYEELFGSELREPDIKESDTITTPGDVNEYHVLEEAEAGRLSYRQDRYLVTDTRASPPEAPHFLPPDLRPWMTQRNDAVGQSLRSVSNSVPQSSSTYTRSDTTRTGSYNGSGDARLNSLLRGIHDPILRRQRTVEESPSRPNYNYEPGIRLRRDERRRDQYVSPRASNSYRIQWYW